MNKADFFAWDEGVTSLLHANGLIGHILDPMDPIDPTRPDRVPSVMPVLPLSPTSADITCLTRWWDSDNIAQHILTSRIGSVPRGLLPSPNLVRRTALSIYQTLARYYGTCSFADCAELYNSLNGLYCQPGRVQEYVSRWCSGLSRLQSARFPFSIKLCVSQFIRGLPVLPAFNTLQAVLLTHVADAGDQDYGSFVTITETALELDVIFRSAAHVPRSSCIPLSSMPSLDLTDSVPKSIQSSAQSSSAGRGQPATSTFDNNSLKVCSNCGKHGHLIPTCFAPGGGMEGRRDEYKRDRNKVVAMLVASLDEAYDVQEDPSADDPLIMAISPTDVPTIALPLPTLPVSSSTFQNDYVLRDLYPMRDPIKPSVFTTSSKLDSLALMTLGDRFNSCLDSGCTDHIIKDKGLFQTYDTSRAVDVGTANCGSLSAKASGDVSFRLPYRERFVYFTLRHCLHAPDAPINLLSVGAFNEAGLTVTFIPDQPTSLSYPSSDPELPDFTFFATVVRRLSLL